MSGKLIVIDGIDGSGKTEQIQRLQEALEFSDFQVSLAKFPDHDSHSGKLIAELLESKEKLKPEATAILHAVNHTELAGEIKKELALGKIVIVQRYVLANLVHNSMNFLTKEDRVKFYKWLDHLEFGIFGIPKPDLNIILDMGETLAHKNIREAHKPRENQSVNYLEKCRKIYLEVAKLLPNTKLVECSKNGEMLSLDAIHNQIWEIVRRLVLNKPGDKI
jgi:dTMP kinase